MSGAASSTRSAAMTPMTLPRLMSGTMTNEVGAKALSRAFFRLRPWREASSTSTGLPVLNVRTRMLLVRLSGTR